ncbi:hypothetical protein [Streptomyces cyaneogriseus]|uniref:hypothetical protein n=1 Tax=Streptomyces cyaneogriseus TaxID=68192 RepID=UPI000A7A451C|nr:hypothetical protein [Streptomyces cyaneogriseus]
MYAIRSYARITSYNVCYTKLLRALQPWLERTLATLPPQHRNLLRTYAQWSVLRQARRRAARRRFTSASATRARNTIRCAGAFLLWLDEHHTALADLTQHQVDLWLTGPLERRHVRPFLRWAHQRRLTGLHDVRPRPRGEAPTWFSDTEHWAHLQRCLHDDTLPLDVRAAKALMLLYGMPVSKITELTSDRLHDGDQPVLILGDHPTDLPPAVHRLLRRQADHAHQESAIGRTTPPATWIVPGYAPGTHRSPAALAAKLRRHQMPAHPSRNTALLTLATDLPAPVLSDLLGISITSALHWTRRAARDWNAYLTSR